MLKAVRASITSGILSYIMSRPKVVPLQSQKIFGFLLLEDNDFLLQEDESKIKL